MFHAEEYLKALTKKLQAAFGDRLSYVGLQGSYLRGEAQEESDIDVMVVVKEITPDDLDAYRAVINTLDMPEKSCGFLCGLEEMAHWNPLEIGHLLHTTLDYFGHLHRLVPPWTDRDVLNYVKLSVGNIYHELVHRRIHETRDTNIQALPGTCKGVFYILQNLHYLDTGNFIRTKQELLSALKGLDRQALETALSIAGGAPFDIDAAFSLLLSWCQQTLTRTV